MKKGQKWQMNTIIFGNFCSKSEKISTEKRQKWLGNFI
jgi:hypothetical protein